MNTTLIHQLPPTQGNPRNSEGAFLRGKKGEILFAYSRYSGDSNHDHASCDIALIRSFDEGRSWSAPRIIVSARKHFGTANVMSVSALEQQNGDLAFYFLIKENDFSTSIGRCVSSDGEDFFCERCNQTYPKEYYVVNNDRLVRLSDGCIAAPAEWIPAKNNRENIRTPYTATCLLSDDDGKTFRKANFDHTIDNKGNKDYGFQEPGIIELSDRLYFWIRTGLGRQYETSSTEGPDNFPYPTPSIFTSPLSPMQIKKHKDILYAVYNPVPRWNGSEQTEFPGTWGRTPIVLRKSEDEGITWGPLNVIEDDPARGYSYPAMFFTRDEHLLIAYCRGDGADGNNLCRLGISRIELSSIE